MKRESLIMVLFFLMSIAIYPHSAASLSCIPQSIRCGEIASICSSSGDSWIVCGQKCEKICSETVLPQHSLINTTMDSVQEMKKRTISQEEHYGVIGQFYSFFSRAANGNNENAAALSLFFAFCIAFLFYWKKYEG